MLSGAKSVIRNASQISAARGLALVSRIIYIIFLARELGPELYGLLAYGQSWYMAFLPLAALGLDGILSREVGANKIRDSSTVLGKVVAIRAIAAPSIGLTCAVFGLIVDPEAFDILLVFSLALIARGYANTTEQIFTAHEVSHYSLNQELVFRPFEVVVGLLILFLGGGVLAIALWHATVWSLQAIRGVWLTRRYLGCLPIDWDYRGWVSILKEGILLLIGSSAYTWILQGPLIIYRHISPDETSLGYIALVFQAIFALCIVPWSLVRAGLPVLARSLSYGDGKDVLFASSMIQFAFLLGGLGGILGTALGPPLITFVMGSEYLATAVYLGWGLWLLLPFCIATALQALMVAEKRPLGVTVPCVIGMILVTLLVLFLFPIYGPIGVFFGTGVGMVVWAGILIVLSRGTRRRAIMENVLLCSFVLGLALLSGVIAKQAYVSEWMCVALECIVLIVGVCLIGLSQKSQRQFIVDLLD